MVRVVLSITSWMLANAVDDDEIQLLQIRANDDCARLNRCKTSTTTTPPTFDCADYVCSSGLFNSGGADVTCAAECTDSECCVAEENCADYTCPRGYESTGMDDPCQNNVCTTRQCCQQKPTPAPTSEPTPQDCDDYVCPSGMFNSGGADMVCAAECTDDECCVAEENCADYTCPRGYESNGMDKACQNNMCSTQQCCQQKPTPAPTPEPTPDDCEDYVCPSGMFNSGGADMVCAAECTDDECCVAEENCADYTCPRGYESKGMDKACKNNMCSTRQCCQKNPTPAPTPSVTPPPFGEVKVPLPTPTPTPQPTPQPTPATCEDFMPSCHTVVTSGDCELVAHTVATDVHCGGNMEYVGGTSVSYGGRAYAANGEGWHNNLVRFAGGTADISESNLQFDKYVELMQRFQDTDAYFSSYLEPRGWVKFGKTGQSFYKEGCETKNPGGVSITERCLIHVVKATGDLSVNYKDILDLTGLDYQWYHGDLLRYCPTRPNSFTCTSREPYQDDNEGRRTLVVFETDGLVTLKTHGGGRKWGPAVLAPLAGVKCDSDFCDGSIIAREVIAKQGYTSSQMHGECFNQEVMC